MPPQQIPEGELFSRVYLREPTPLRDSPRFRTRLYGYIAQYLWDFRNDFVEIIIRELGISIPTFQTSTNYYEWHILGFFTDSELRDILDSISLGCAGYEGKTRNVEGTSLARLCSKSISGGELRIQA